MRTFFGKNKVRLFVMAMVVMTLAAGCADELETVPRPQDAAVSDQVDGAPSKDVALDQATKDAGDVEMADKATPDVVFVTDVLDVIAADRGDVPAAADRADAPTVTDGPRDATDAGDNGAPCPPDRTTTCGAVCVNVQTDATNCGACFNACALANATPACTAGRCTVAACNTGFANCDGNDVNGCEANPQTDARNCGTCGNGCVEPMPLCSSGRCIGGVCPMGMTRCGDSSCVDTQTDVRNCNGCGTACTEPPNAAASCTAGRCGFTCDAGFRDCDGVAANGCEVETAASVTNCGACGTACTLTNATPTCAAGHCTVASCATGFANCDGNDANGCETDTRTSTAHCGRCGGVCPAGGTCTAGACTVTVPVSVAGRLQREVDRSFMAAYEGTEAAGANAPVPGVASYGSGSNYIMARGWFLIPTPRGTLLRAMVTFAPMYLVQALDATIGVQAVSFGAMISSATRLPSDSAYIRTSWGTDAFFTTPIPFGAFTTPTPVSRDLTEGGLRYFQASAGGETLLGLRTTADIGGMAPSAGGSLELRPRASGIWVTVTFTYRP